MLSDDSDERAGDDRSLLLRPHVFARLGVVVLFMAMLFWVAGRVTWWQGWSVCSAFILLAMGVSFRLARRDPELFKERTQTAENVESWDRILMRIYGLFFLMLFIVAALDSGRFGWSEVPVWAQASGWLLALAAGKIVSHVMAHNTFASRYARLQADRGQIVVRDGLYARIRHPMYLGIILLFGALPLMLASLWSLIPAAINMGVIVYRTHREDRMLLEGLEGYTEYAKEVPYRLFPGIW